jgi:hypothetical protein
MPVPQTEKPKPSHAAANADNKNVNGERGFTIAEKWVIWAVFLLLIGLSSDFLVFPALLLLSYSIIMLRRVFKTKSFRRELWLGSSALLASAALFWWALSH